jgi:hypothetical protein
MATVT